jgi:hypothetical protein
MQHNHDPQAISGHIQTISHSIQVFTVCLLALTI